MKRFAPILPITLFIFLLISGCKKIDWRPTDECEVRQFSSVNFPPTPGETSHPFLFSKTFDASGNVSTMDAYLFTLGPDSRHLKIKMAGQGQTIYLLNMQKANDTFLVVTMNSKGRPVKAVEKFTDSWFLSNKNYTFEYDSKNRVSAITRQDQPSGTSFPASLKEPVTYDTYGNALSVMGDAFEYDYSKTAKQQFYIDYNAFNILYGFKLLQYLNMFPEINSPKHLRIATRIIPLGAGQYYLNAVLSNHKFDNKGKLISYDFAGSLNGTPITAPISWNCDNGKQ